MIGIIESPLYSPSITSTVSVLPVMYFGWNITATYAAINRCTHLSLERLQSLNSILSGRVAGTHWGNGPLS